MLQSIHSEISYNLGGINSILLLDIDHFQGYEFEGDNLYDNFFVNKVFRTGAYIELDVVKESTLSQSSANEIYKIELKSFIRVARSKITYLLEYAKRKRFVVFFKSMQGQYFTFGSDGGVQLSYSLQTDAVQGVNGLAIGIQKNSIYPIFEISTDAIFKIPSHFLPHFNKAYCVQSAHLPQFDNDAYCVSFEYQPQFKSFICQTN